MAEQQLATIKRPGQKEYISKDEWEARIREIAKCKRDIVYFAENYFRVINLDKGLHIIKLYDVQKDFLRFLVENNKTICVSGRQQGKSTIYCIYALWQATFFAEKKIMILANKSQTALELLGRIETAYEYLPLWIKCAAVELNKSSITFSNMSCIKAFASSSDAARGFSANCVILDEFAFLQKSVADKLFTSMYPVISSSKNGKFIIVSTPNGMDNLYYEIWQQANSKEKKDNLEGWKPFTMYWWQVPGHDEAWKEKQIAAIGEQRFAQEFNNEFLASSGTRKLIPQDITDKYRIKLQELKTKNKDMYIGKHHQIVSEDETKLFEFTMWHEFDPQKTYAASGDAAEGGGGDSSILYVWDITDLSDIKMCVKFESDKISLTEFAFVTSKILGLYNNPYYICERNGVGSGYLDSLRITYGYQNIVTEGKNNDPGVYSQAYNKSKTCLWARDMMTTQGFGFTLYDKDLIDEFSTFVKKDTKNSFIIYTALAGAHDDHIMAFIWLTYLLQNEIIEKYFVVCETFTDSLGNNRAKIVMPQKAYSGDQIKAVTNDPMYKDFLEFKEELTRKYGLALKAESESANKDIFQMAEQNMDMYFGGGDGPSWNSPSSLPTRMQNAQDLNPNNRMPAFFVN